MKNNFVSAKDQSNALIITATAASTKVIPDYAETVYISGTTTINNIFTFSQFVFNEKVVDVTMTNNGTGYTPGSNFAVTFASGGGAGAAATAAVDNAGKVIGVSMTNNGSGYTSTPSVSFAAGTGSSAAGTAIVGVNNFEGRILNVMFQSNVTVVDGGNLALNGNLSATAATTLTLRGAYGTWFEVSRSIN